MLKRIHSIKHTFTTSHANFNLLNSRAERCTRVSHPTLKSRDFDLQDSNTKRVIHQVSAPPPPLPIQHYPIVCCIMYSQTYPLRTSILCWNSPSFWTKNAGWVMGSHTISAIVTDLSAGDRCYNGAMMYEGCEMRHGLFRAF